MLSILIATVCAAVLLCVMVVLKTLLAPMRGPDPCCTWQIYDGEYVGVDFNRMQCPTTMAPDQLGWADIDTTSIIAALDRAQENVQALYDSMERRPSMPRPKPITEKVLKA